MLVASTAGDPAEEIVRYARAHDIDLIVLGTRGRTGFSRALLGSVAERVARPEADRRVAGPSRRRLGWGIRAPLPVRAGTEIPRQSMS